MIRRSLLSALFLITSAASLSAAPATQSSDDAWPLYRRAIERVAEGDRHGISSPAASSLVYNDYPPYPAEWHRMENTSYAFNAPARALVREARSKTTAHWPVGYRANGEIDLSYLNGCRNLANEVADAALYQYLQGDTAAALESIRDLLHMADLLDQSPRSAIVPLVAMGVRAISLHRLEIIAAGAAFTADPTDSKQFQVADAKRLIRQLFDGKDPAPRYAELLKRETAAGEWTTVQTDRFLTQARRSQTERNLAAMSLACHLFRLEKDRWPASVANLTAYLPAPPHDAWGPMGYILLPPSKPGGPERPLVYSRCNSKDGLFYSTFEPDYFWDPGFGTGSARKQGGQFRDVTLWTPTTPNPPPATQPLP